MVDLLSLAGASTSWTKTEMTTSGTFTHPDPGNDREFLIVLLGGGGGGGGGSSTGASYNADGGGGGSSAIPAILNFTSNANFDLLIGAGGSGSGVGGDGGDGGNTTIAFGSINFEIYSPGGNGGGGAVSNTAGSGGSAPSDLRLPVWQLGTGVSGGSGVSNGGTQLLAHKISDTRIIEGRYSGGGNEGVNSAVQWSGGGGASSLFGNGGDGDLYGGESGGIGAGGSGGAGAAGTNYDAYGGNPGGDGKAIIFYR